MTDFNGAITEYVYNPVGKVEKITDPQGGITVLKYDKAWNIASATDPLGNTVTFKYDVNNRLSKTTDPEGNETSYRHDANGNVVSITNPLGAKTMIYYDALNRPKQVTEPDGAITAAGYDCMGNVTKITDALGNVTTREYDLAGQLTKVTDALGNETTITYTPLGNISSITDAKGAARTYDYYPGGLLKKVELPDGETESYEYNKNGNISKVTDGFGFATTLEYDGLNRVIKTTNPLGYSKQYEYDAASNVTKMTDENSNETQYRYSLLGDIIEVTDATGHSTGYTYDATRRLTELKQYNALEEPQINTVGEPQITAYQYDKVGNIITTTSPLGDIVKYYYDKVGNVVSKLDEDGYKTLFAYNLANQIEKITYADGRTVELSYNPLKQLTEMKDWLGTTTIELDKLGRATKVTDHDGNVVGYAWNALGQREKTVYPDGSVVSFQYNKAGRIEKVIATTGETLYQYDKMGRITSRILPDGTTSDYKFNPLGAIERLTHSTKSGIILDDFMYSYDPAGNKKQIEKHRMEMESDSGLFEFTYDELNRLCAVKHGNDLRHYQYDSLGNRASQWSGTKHQTYDDNPMISHSYNKRNQLTKTSIPKTSITREYKYDKRGNMTGIVENGQLTATYIFDAMNMMTRAETDKGVVDYTYNGFRGRISKTEKHNERLAHNMNTHTSQRDYRCILDMTKPFNNLLAISGKGSNNFIWSRELISVNGNADDAHHYLQDHLGSNIRITGNSDYSYGMAYDELGVKDTFNVPVNDDLKSPFGYTGYQDEEITGLYYAQSRYYCPVTSRFISQDPIRAGTNWYAYCNNNPINRIDPLGLDSFIFTDPYEAEHQALHIPDWTRQLANLFHGGNTDRVHLIPMTSPQAFIDGWDLIYRTPSVDAIVILGHSTGTAYTIAGDVNFFISGCNDPERARDDRVVNINDLPRITADFILLMGCNSGNAHHDQPYADPYGRRNIAKNIVLGLHTITQGVIAFDNYLLVDATGNVRDYRGDFIRSFSLNAETGTVDIFLLGSEYSGLDTLLESFAMRRDIPAFTRDICPEASQPRSGKKRPPVTLKRKELLIE